MYSRERIIKPGTFSVQVAADFRRGEFDAKNEVIVSNCVPVDFVFIGDSITHAWELNAYFGRSGRLVLNRGIGGDTPYYVHKRFDADVIQLKPRYAVMKIGINETWVLDNKENADQYEQVYEKVRSKILDSIRDIVKLCDESGQKLILCSVLPTFGQVTPQPRTRNDLILEVNEELKKICRDNELIYVDYHSQMTGEDGKTLRSELSEDGCHPHVLGYNIMADVLRKRLAEFSIEI